ncbi:MAG: radical SAM family heme chaperone HemW [Crocinitomicaceae bacterium]|nr:radical SAM family heme chaperone HemW [Crocinitomicaceae bacterium]
MAGIYVHVPFCKVKCHYCDFHFSTNLSNQEALVEAILEEISLRALHLENQTIETIYFGGGTPSLLTRSQLQSILKAVYKNFSVKSSAEITSEANPDDLSSEKLLELKEIGVNRLSIGIQSFEQRHLEYMNRAHNSEEALNCIKLAQENGFNNITIDLIYGLPNQSLDDWKKELDKFLNLNIPHLSAYCLTIEPNTYFGHLQKNKNIPLPEDELSNAQFKYLIEVMTKNNYDHYEISNFAKEGFISQHNSAYWRNKPYLGIGPSAHSYFNESRSWNIANNPRYIKAIRNKEEFTTTELLSLTDQFNEYILTRLRTKWGVEVNDLINISKDLWEKSKPIFDKEFDAGHLNFQDGNYTLTTSGKFLSDNISANLFVD